MNKVLKSTKHIWEGWRVCDFIDALEPSVDLIMSGQSYIPPFINRDKLTKWCTDSQPYYKKTIPGVIDYFSNKYNIN